jgi:hypothetical protein
MRIRWMFLLLLVAGCKQDALQVDEDPAPLYIEPLVRPVGQVQYEAVQSVIGTEGGSLAYGEEIQVHVPAGAVENNTVFSIQPISNTLEEGTSQWSYRIMPEGVSFKKPLEIRFKVEEGDKESAFSRMIAYQSPQGIWLAAPTSWDTQERYVKTSTDHLSDWVWFDRFTLRKNKISVPAGGQVELRVMERVLGALTSHQYPDFVPLAALDEIGSSRDIVVKNWKILKGPGQIAPKTNTHMLQGNAIYTAPAQVGEDIEVEIQVEVESKHGYIPDPQAPGGKRKFGKMILLTTILLQKDVVMFVEVDGVQYDFSAGAGAALMNNHWLVSGADQQGNQVTLLFNGAHTGNYPGGQHAHQVFVMLSLPSTNARRTFQNSYLHCSGEQIYGGIGQIHALSPALEGYFNGEVFFSDKACGFTDSKQVSLYFKIKDGS